MVLTTASPTGAARSAEGNRPGRILLVAPQPFYDDRGTPIAVHHVLRALSTLGHEVDVLTYPVGRAVDIAGVHLIRTANPFRIRHVPIGLSVRKVLLDALLVGALRRQLRRHRYVCIHAVEEAAFPAVLFGRRHGIPVIYDMQSSLPEQLAQQRLFRPAPVFALLRRCERWLLEHADAVMSSAGLACTLQSTAGAVRVREWSFPSAAHAVDATEVARLRDRLAIPAGAPAVVYAGTFENYQGLDTLIGAVAQVAAVVPQAVLVLVGGTEADNLAAQRQVAANGVGRRVRLAGRQPREAMPVFYAMADVLVSSRSYGGNLPLKVFDYLAAGRPIVATDIPTHRTVLDDDRAVLVPPTADGLAGGILRVLLDAGTAARLADAARDYALRHFGWERFVRSVQEVYGGLRPRA